MTIIKELLTTYWNNILIILAIFGFWGQWYFNLRSKKIETKYLLFQQNKIVTVIKFYSCFTRAHKMWETFPIYKVLSQKLSVIDMDNIITPSLQDMKICLFELSLYFNEEDMKVFDSVNEQLTSINSLVYQIFFGDIKDDNTKLANKFSSTRDI